MKKIGLYLGIITVILICIFGFNIRTFRVQGHSMSPTLEENNFVISKKIKLEQVKRGDLLVFTRKGNTLIKRVIGLPKEKIVLTEEGKVYVNDTLLEENYIDQFAYASEIEYPYMVPENTLFVLGDNRKDSMDSRIINFGTIHESAIIGKIIYTVPIH